MFELKLYTKKISLRLDYLKTPQKAIPLFPRDVITRPIVCPACGASMTPFLSVTNKIGIPVLEKPLCLDCGYAHFSRLPRSSWFKRYYADEWDTWNRTEASIKGKLPREEGENVKTFLSLGLSRDARILDLGAGYGHFIQAAIKYGYKNICGIEASSYRANYCREKLGLDVRQGPAEECASVLGVKARKDRFDLIHSNHVLEHVDDIDRVVAECLQLLNPGGQVIAFVPNWLRNEWIVNMAHSLTHVRHFTPRSLSLIFDKHGFEVQEAHDSVSLVARKPILVRERRTSRIPPRSGQLSSLVTNKICRNFGLCEADPVEGAVEVERFWIRRIQKEWSLFNDKLLGVGDKAVWRCKKMVYGVSFNARAITGLSDWFRLLFSPRVVAHKIMSKVVFFDRIEMGGCLSVSPTSDTSKASIEVEFNHPGDKVSARLK